MDARWWPYWLGAAGAIAIAVAARRIRPDRKSDLTVSPKVLAAGAIVPIVVGLVASWPAAVFCGLLGAGVSVVRPASARSIHFWLYPATIGAAVLGVALAFDAPSDPVAPWLVGALAPFGIVATYFLVSVVSYIFTGIPKGGGSGSSSTPGTSINVTFEVNTGSDTSADDGE